MGLWKKIKQKVQHSFNNLIFCETQIWSTTLCWNSYKCLRLWNESLRKFLQKNLESVSFINQRSICGWEKCLFKFEILWPVHSSPLNQVLIQCIHQLVNPPTKSNGQPPSLSLVVSLRAKQLEIVHFYIWTFVYPNKILVYLSWEWNTRFGANLKKLFFRKICSKCVTFLNVFSAFLHEKCWKWLFWPGFGVRSTQMLVEIYNNWAWVGRLCTPMKLCM